MSTDVKVVRGAEEAGAEVQTGGKGQGHEKSQDLGVDLDTGNLF